ARLWLPVWFCGLFFCVLLWRNTRSMPANILYRGRRAAAIENSDLRLTVLEGGGHIAEVLHKRSGVNPLWTPPWPSIEPGQYVAATDTTYGAGVESQLLAGIMGHNLCLDIFGGPSAEEYTAGLQPHGEASIVAYELSVRENEIRAAARLPKPRLPRRGELRLS